MASRPIVTIEGLGETLEGLQGFRVKVTDLHEAFGRIGTAISADAHGRVPVRSGRLLASLKVGRAKGKATVRAGSARVPYAGVINYGGYHNIQPRLFLNQALEGNVTRATREIETELSKLIRDFRLNNP